MANRLVETVRTFCRIRLRGRESIKRAEAKGDPDRRFPIKSVFVIAFVIVLFLLAYRSHAEGRGESVSDGAEVPTAVATRMGNATEYLSRSGIKMSYEKLGDVTSIEDAIDVLVSDSEYFVLVFFDGDSSEYAKHHVWQFSSRDGVMKSLRSEIGEKVAIGDGVYRLVIDDEVTHMTMSGDGTRYSGVFPMASRIDVTVAKMFDVPPEVEEVEDCRYEVLSRTVFGRSAEALQACVEVTCSDDDMDSGVCTLAKTRTWHGFFGFVIVSGSEEQPDQADMSGDTCKRCVTYEWGVGIKIESKLSIEIVGPGGSGDLCVEAKCLSE